MAGSKRVPLTLGNGGPVVGSAHIDENGFLMAEIDDIEVTRKLFRQGDFSLSVNGTTDGGAQ